MYVAYRYARELTPSKIPAGSVCRLFPSRYLVGASGGGAGRPKMGCTRISWRFGLGSASCSLQLVSIGFRVKEDTYTRMYVHHTHIYIYMLDLNTVLCFGLATKEWQQYGARVGAACCEEPADHSSALLHTYLVPRR